MFLEEMFNSSTAAAMSKKGRDADMLEPGAGDHPTLVYLKGLLAWKQGNATDVSACVRARGWGEGRGGGGAASNSRGRRCIALPPLAAPGSPPAHP